jgi:hypothetical protein
LALVDVICQPFFLLAGVDVATEKRTPFPDVGRFDAAVELIAISIYVDLGIQKKIAERLYLASERIGDGDP